MKVNYLMIIDNANIQVKLSIDYAKRLLIKQLVLSTEIILVIMKKNLMNF